MSGYWRRPEVTGQTSFGFCLIMHYLEGGIERPKFNSRVIYFCGAVKTSLAAKIIRRFQSPPVVVSDVLKPPGWRHYRVHIGQRNLQLRFWKHSRIFTY
jgi:hypothetical protein